MIEFLAGITLSENDKRLLVIFLVIVLVVFILIGLLGMLVRSLFRHEGVKIDDEVHDAVVYRVVASPDELRVYGEKKNRRVYMKEMTPPFLIGLGLLLFYIVYSAAIGDFSINHFDRFSTLFYVYDWNDPDIYVNLWGMNILNEWPSLIHAPYLDGQYWASYLTIILFAVFLVYFLYVSMAFLARSVYLRRRCRSVYEKTLEGYNFYDALKGDKEKALSSEKAKSDILKEETSEGKS